MSNFYPERLGLVICINHNPVFQGVWNAIKVFLHPNTVAKMQLVRKKKQYRVEFARIFSDELTNWLLDEIKLNKRRPMTTSQREFWRQPEPASAAAAMYMMHDPRGCQSFVAQYIDKFEENFKADPVCCHRPHPNIIDALNGSIKSATPCSSNGKATARGSVSSIKGAAMDLSNSSDEETDQMVEVPFQIDEEFRIPTQVDNIKI